MTPRPHAEATLAHRPVPVWSEAEDTVHARFLAVAQRHPRRIAVRAGAHALTYGELHQRVLAAAAYLDCETGEPLGIALPAGLDFIVAVLASLRQGRPYIPLSLTQPQAVRDEIIHAAGLREVLTSSLVLPTVAADTPAPPPRARPESVACVLYTSGSTGRPKGVYQSQAILLHDIRSYGETIRLQADDVLTWLYPPQTGGAVRDLFGALLHGAELVVMDPGSLGLGGIARTVQERAITVFHAIPPLLREFLATAPARDALASVRMLYVAGDRFFRSDLESIRRVFPAESLVYTGLGATECTTLYRHWVLSSDTAVATELVPVGFDVPGKRTRLVDEQGDQVTPGEIGAIEVTSAYIASGYWRNSELSHEAFRVDPTHPDQRIYRTGDQGRLLPDGNLVFVGRADGQAKIRGHRIECDAVEAALRGVPGIREAVALVRPGAEPELIAFLVADASRPGEPESTRTERVRATLADRLPAAAVPARLVWREALPRLDSYKVDRRRLLDAFTGDRDGMEAESDASVAGLWRRALGVAGALDPDRSFAEASGNSLAALRLHAELEKRLGRPLPLGLLHGGQTLRGLWRELERCRQGSCETDARPVWFLVGGIDWSIPHADTFAHDEDPPVRLQFVSLLEAAERSALEVPALGRHVAEAVLAWQRREGTTAPVGLLGLSLGALIAHEAACCLQERNVALAALIAYDLGPACPQLSTAWSYRLRKSWRALRRGERRFRLAWAFQAALGFLLPITWARALRARASDRSQRAERGLDRLVLRSLPGWTPRRYNGELLLLKPVDGFGKEPGVPPDFGWGPHARSVRAAEVPGGHIDALAPAVRESLLQHLSPGR